MSTGLFLKLTVTLPAEEPSISMTDVQQPLKSAVHAMSGK
jgi:hypothetical protein